MIAMTSAIHTALEDVEGYGKTQNAFSLMIYCIVEGLGTIAIVHVDKKA